ncbi:MAG: T9SS type A sorting domain-containing protein, partial [Pedobacter sp.]
YNSSDALLETDAVPMFVGTNIALPLTLVSFNAVKAGSDVSVYWNTTQENNAKDFDVEWSTDGISWTKIVTKPAFNRSTGNYDFIHTTPINGKNFYRLKMNDIDARYTYSSVRIVNFDEKSNTSIVLIPNPAKNNTVLYFENNFRASQVNIYNAAGALVQQIKVGAGVRQLDISTTSLANGVYTLVTNGETTVTTKMVVAH